MIKSIEEGRKEDGNRSIADKIIKRLHDLEKTVQNNHGRWAWELLQNAKDSIAETDRNVSVCIKYNSDRIEFSHNGNYFTERDIRGLINQISSKEVEEGEVTTRTGRFGTGFLTTHLLSKEVFINGVVETIGGELFRFGFNLNRNGKTTSELIPKIEKAWEEFHSSTENNKVVDYNQELFNTSFGYSLDSEEQKEIAQIGIDEFTKLIPFVLAFIPEISQVEIINETNDDKLLFRNEDKPDQENFKLIYQSHNNVESIIKLLFVTNSTVSIAARLRDIDGGGIEIVNLDDIPKIFCDFPLIGTEDFHFPIVVNSFNFNPQTERDGIWLMGDSDAEVIENKELLIQALALYKELINDIGSKPIKNIFNIAKTKTPSTDEKYFDSEWYKGSIQKPLRDFLFQEKIVEMEGDEKSCLNELWFPLKTYTKEIRESLWKYTYDLYPSAVCKREDLHDWIEIIWEGVNKITFSGLVEDIANIKSITKLSEYFNNDEDEALRWLNEVGKFLIEDEVNLPLLDKKAIIPNENKNFLVKENLYIDKIKDTELIKVLKFLGEDWNEILLHRKISFASYKVKNRSDIALKINEKLKTFDNRNENFIKAISLLSEWFDNNPEEGKEFFSETYRKRAELFMNTIQDKDSLYKVMRSKTDLSHLSKVAAAIEENPSLYENIQQAKEIYSLLKQYNVNDIDELKDLLDNKEGGKYGKSELLPVTQEILADMGISSLEEWQKAIRDKNLAALYSHTSTPTTDMFVYVQSLIQKAKLRIIDHLKTLPNYNLEDLDDTTAPTVLADITKDGYPISIVVRPAYNGEVIIYYGSERDVLDFEPSELWIDDGNLPRKISLGHLLKKAQIVKFPV